MTKMDNFVSNCFRSMVQPFFLKVLMSSFERHPFEKLPSRGGEWGPLLKQKLYTDWIFLFQSKILNFAMISFHQMSLSTFKWNFALKCNVKKFEIFE